MILEILPLIATVIALLIIVMCGGISNDRY